MKSIRLQIALMACIFHLQFMAAQRITSLKAYGNMAIGKSVSIPYFEEENRNAFLKFTWASIAVKYQYDSGRFREFELTNLELQRRPNEDTDTRFSVGFRYKYGKMLTKSVNAPLTLSIGASIRSAYALEQLNGLNIIGIPSQNEYYSLALGLHPHLEFLIKKHVIVELCPNVDIGNFTARSEYVYDEFIEEEQRSSIDFYFKAFQFFASIGAGWRF